MNSILATSIREKIKFLNENKSQLIIDSDTHLTNIENLDPVFKERYNSTPNYYHGKPIGLDQILIEMSISDVDMCLIWQNPAVTRYSNNKTENFNNLLKSNRYIFETAQIYPTKFIPAGWVDPVAIEMNDALKLVDICAEEFGFPFIKMNPAQNKYPIDSQQVFKMVERIIHHGAFPAFHFGADTPFTPLSGLLNIAKTYPDTPIIAVHMGGGGSGYVEAEHLYNTTREAGLKYQNLKFIESAKRDTHIESDFITYEIAGKPYNTNIMCASDAPYGKISWNFGGFRAMFKSLENKNHPDVRLKNRPNLFSQQVAQRYMGGNMASLAIEAYTSILNKNN